MTEKSQPAPAFPPLQKSGAFPPPASPPDHHSQQQPRSVSGQFHKIVTIPSRRRGTVA